MNKAGKIALNPEPQTHLIRKADFDINFDSARVAEQFETEVYQWLMHELLPSIDELLTQLCSADTMICLDKLEIDTGDIPSENFRPALQKQVLLQLYQEIYQNTHSGIPTKERTSFATNAKNQHGGRDDNSITQHELSDYRWQQAWFFIESGQLRWPFKHNQHLSETGLVEVLLNYPARIDNSLSAAHNSPTLCLRLAMQLPDESLAQLLQLLSRKNRFLLMIALLETGPHHNPRLEKELTRYWQSLADSAISNRNLASLLPYWDRLMTSDSSGLLFAIGKHSKDSHLPLLLIQSLNEAQRFSFLERLEPSNYPFLVQLLTSPTLWLRRIDTQSMTISGQVHTLASSQNITRHLWHFTFHYVLVERGSRFNKQQYMKSMIVKMAAMQNLKTSELFADLRNALLHIGIDSSLRQQMMTLLDAIEPDIFREKADKKLLINADKEANNQAKWDKISREIKSATARTNKSDDLNALLLILQQGDEQSLLHALPEDKQAIKRLLVWIGQLAAVRQHWSEHYSDSTLFRFIDIIEPKANDVVHDIFSSRQLIERATAAETKSGTIEARVLRSSLWQFTLSYLLIQRGSEFNKKSYLLSLTHQIAAHRNLHHRELIQSLLSTLNGQANHRLVEALRALLPEPENSARKTYALETGEIHSLNQAEQHQLNHIAAIHPDVPFELIQALMEANLHQWQRVLNGTHARLNSKALASIIIMLSKSGTIRSRWIQNFDEQTRIQLITLTNQHYEDFSFDIFERAAQQKSHSSPTNLALLLQKVQAAHSTLKLSDKHRVQLRQWLSSSTTQDETIKHITNWNVLQSNQLDKAKLELALSRYHHALWKHLTTELQNKDKLAIWINRLAVHQHFEMFAQQRSEFMPVVISLYQALVFSLGNTPEWKQAFWRVIYHRLLIQGFTGTASQLLQLVLHDLTHYPAIVSELGADSTNDKTKQLVAKINVSRQSILFPMLAALSRTTSTAKVNTPAAPAGLERSQPQVQRLCDAIEPRRAENADKPLIWKDPNEEERITSQPISINNAGLVLSSTYIPTLFQRLNLTEGKAFISEKTKFQALFCLQYMVDGRSEAPEYLLALNKLLCGIPLSSPIPNQIDLPDGAMSMIDGLLTAMISHWSALGSTSVEGLRTTFLLREGQLLEEEKQWQLNVLPGPFDMLLDQIPWSFQTIKYPWMDKPLFVTWR